MRTVTTRTQRRMERKQALLLLVLVLAVSLVSFTLGVMVGRGGAKQATSGEAERPRPVVREQSSLAPLAGATATEEAAVDLTFYETLPKGEQPPLGSGINLPPEQKGGAAEEAPPPSSASAPAKGEAEPVARSVPLPVISPKATTANYVLQVASFRIAKDAQALSRKLEAKGYSSEVREVDLGEKGLWSRVLVGPYGTEEEARSAQRRLKDEEGLSPMLRKD